MLYALVPRRGVIRLLGVDRTGSRRTLSIGPHYYFPSVNVFDSSLSAIHFL